MPQGFKDFETLKLLFKEIFKL